MDVYCCKCSQKGSTVLWSTYVYGEDHKDDDKFVLYFAIGSSQEDNLQQAVLNLTAFLEEYQPMSLAVDACRHKILVENCTSINSEL